MYRTIKFVIGIGKLDIQFALRLFEICMPLSGMHPAGLYCMA
jgi:hypothetical protein